LRTFCWSMNRTYDDPSGRPCRCAASIRHGGRSASVSGGSQERASVDRAYQREKGT
jgi:hypothetical protein